MAEFPVVENYEFKIVEEGVLKAWAKNKTYEQAKALATKRGTGKKPFYFLDGPPYTSGKVHLGTAWNKSLKDMVLRQRRMLGLDVYDRAGYDMHGLPTENATQKKLNLTTKEDIAAFGVDNFIDECRKLCTTNLKIMNQDFLRLGTWMDYENAYQTISKEYMNGEWWLIKRAHEQGRIYEGLRTMTWCPIAESALAKHELEYHTVTDDSIFVKFKLVDRNGKQPENEYILIWTTTPWTIPYNLAVMVNPEYKYVKAAVETKSGTEYWWIAEALATAFIQGVAELQFKIVEEVTGEQMDNWRYVHPLYDTLKHEYDPIIEQSDRAFTVLLSTEYVDTSAGTGFVHCAPGCGPEDYEVGHKYGIPPYNNLDTKGVVPANMGPFTGLIARTNDDQYTAILKKNGCLIAVSPVEHEYPHDWRYHEPVIFRTTKQWFFKIEDMKDQLIKENDKITWIPKAAYNAFDGWLRNLRDNSISKQRYWGTPLPIWRNTAEDAAEDDYIIIGSSDELEKLSGEKVDDLHISTVDKIEFTKDGKTYRRVPDVLDVWVDAGTSCWNALDYPQKEDLFKKHFPADFILEGKDQIRGWFNLLHIASMLALGKPCFKACYMHGFINDAGGRKMSKSLGNYILPEEVVAKYGADTLRYYMIGAANPAVDLNYNFDDVELKHRNLFVFWNLHKFMQQLQKEGVERKRFTRDKLSIEEQYILSRLHETVKLVSEKYDNYLLNEVPGLIENCLLDLSRTYIQLVREKASLGSPEEKEHILFAVSETFLTCMKLFAPVAPFFTEQVWQNLRSLTGNPFCLDEESIHFCTWPTFDEQWIDNELSQDMDVAYSVISATLAAREKAGIGVRWPLSSATVQCKDELSKSVQHLQHLIEQQTNIKEVKIGKAHTTYEAKANYKALGAKFGQQVPEVAAAINKNQAAIAKQLAEGMDSFTAGEFEINRQMLDLTLKPLDGHQVGEYPGGVVSIDLTTSKKLEAEGFVRELIRRVQQMRKEAGLEKRDRIMLSVAGGKDLLSRIAEHGEYFQSKVGASKLLFVEKLPGILKTTKEVVIRKQQFWLGLEQEK